MSGYIVNQPQPHSAYAVSKAGVHHLARSMAGEWVGHGIRVNSISPGIMNTRLSGGPSQAGLRKLWLEKSPMGIGDPEDLTGAVVLLCSEAGRFITGTDIKIDGSLSCLGIRVWRLTLGVRRLYNFLSEIISTEEVLCTERSQTRMMETRESKDILQKIRSSTTNAICQMLLFIVSRLPVYHKMSDSK